VGAKLLLLDKKNKKTHTIKQQNMMNWAAKKQTKQKPLPTYHSTDARPLDPTRVQLVVQMGAFDVV
jgi:hypothetical protein